MSKARTGGTRGKGEGGGSATGKAFRLLEVLVGADEPPSLAELAVRLGQPKPSVHRLLCQLEELGMVQRDLSGKRFQLGERATEFALRALGSAVHTAPVQTVLQRLVEEVNESCNLGVMERFEVVYVARVECNCPLRMHLRVGSRVPLHCTATGKLFLAHLSAGRRRRLLQRLELTRYTERTLTEPERLEEALEEVRSRGYVINDQEYILGLVGVAVPVFDGTGRMCAGLAVQGPEVRFGIERAVEYVPTLRRAADSLEALLHRNDE